MARNQIFLYTLVIVIAIAAGIWYLMKDSYVNSGNPLENIPQDISILIEIDKPGELYKLLEDDNAIWSQVVGFSAISDLKIGIEKVKSILSGNKTYLDAVLNNKLMVAVYSDSVTGVEAAIFSSIESIPSAQKIRTILETNLSREYGIIEISGIKNTFKIVNASTGENQFLTFLNGQMIYTHSTELLGRIVDTEYENSILSDTAFLKLRNTGGAKAHARVYLNYQRISDISSEFLNADKQADFSWCGNFGSWTEFDLLIKNKELILSGFTAAQSGNYLEALNNQSPINIRAFNILPFNTNQLFWLGVDDFGTYFTDVYSQNKLNQLSKSLNYDLNNLFNIMTGEMVFASNAEISSNYRNNSWFAFGVNDVNQSKAILSRIARNFGNGSASKYSGYTIGKVNNSEFVGSVFASVFGQITENYYTNIGDYVVMANSKQSLITLIDYFETGKTLDLNDNFKEFTDNVSSKSNIFVYVKPSGIINRLSDFFTVVSSRKVELEANLVNSFRGISYQLSAGRPYAFTNVYASYEQGQHEESLALWKVQLNETIAWGPYLVYDHQTKTENIIVFDTENTMYLINADGDILWSKMLDEIPISNIYELDYYKNGKVQYLFNTGNYIYLIDKKGRNVTGFPKKLHSRATNGLVVFDYLRNKDYRIVLAQSDKKIYNYTKKGSEVNGWSQPRMQNIVVAPVKRLVANSKDYIIITDINNEVKIVDRRGGRRIKLRGTINKAKNSDYYVNRTNSKGIIITTNSTGKLIYISSNGSLKTTDFGDFSGDHFFLYEDFNGDKSMDFIYIDGGKLVVFDRFKNELFSYDFGSEISIIPKFFSLDSKRKVLGVVDDADKTIYLFDEKGNIIISKGLIGETQFIVGDLKNNNKINLVSAAGKILYNYRMR